VRQARQRVGRDVRFVEPKSERSRRRVSLPTFAVRALKRHRDQQLAERRLAGSKWVETGLAFTSTIGTAMDERNVRRSFKALLQAAELPDLRLHDLRHTTATLLLTQGVHPRVVMETLGHSQVSLTLERTRTSCPDFRRKPPSECKRRLAVRLAVRTANSRLLNRKRLRNLKKKW
jgi:integrase